MIYIYIAVTLQSDMKHDYCCCIHIYYKYTRKTYNIMRINMPPIVHINNRYYFEYESAILFGAYLFIVYILLLCLEK